MVSQMNFLRSRKWQDWVFTVGEVIFALSLLPSVIGPDKPSPVTSIVTGLTLCTFMLVQASHQYWMALFMIGITALLWFTMAAQVLI